ncbi:ADP-ribosylglycohydrolase family protein [Saccharopolyspora aridisoli]|uniref:ADP-ribosylglycohydrolase family protein n=1 Tax=Saccharopolyspora aridisoli TaxID=2530385 RepID=UPI00140458A4|nr:ADP-ribosylglycohydrolase family protein [Saccharopolyspora aridisoli]
MGENSAEVRRHLVRAWREIKSRPALLPLSWFTHVDDSYNNLESRSRFGGTALPVTPRRADEWEFVTFGRVLGMLVGGAFGDAAGSIGRMPIEDLLSTFRSASPDGSEVIRDIASFAGLAGDVAAVPVDAAALDPALVPGLRTKNPGELGCLAASVPAALAGVFDSERDLFRRTRAVARALGDDDASAGVLAVALQTRLRDAGTDLNRFVRRALNLLDDGDADMRARLEALLDVAGTGFDLSLPEAMARLDGSESVPAVVARALLLAWRFSSADRAVMNAAAGTDRLTAVITGLLVGARDGAGAFPLLWRRRSEALPSLEARAEQLFRRFGPADGFIRQTVFGLRGEPTASRRFLGAVVGAMIGEELGRQVSSESLPEIVARFGDTDAGLLRPTEDEFMPDGMALLVVTLDARIRLDRALVSGQDPIGEMRATYELWASAEVPAPERAGWLGEHLPQRLARTGVPPLLAEGLAGNASGRPELLYTALPAGLWACSSRDVIAHARDAVGALGESGNGIAPAQALAVILSQTVVTGNYIRGLGHVIEANAEEFGPGREEMLRLMRAAESLAQRTIAPEQIASLGDGSTPESALAIAACAVEASEGRFDEALRIAVSHPGDRVITGALAGAIIGASFEGIDRLPHWVEALPDWAQLVFRIAEDVPVQLGDNPPDHIDWNRRYPLSSEVPAHTNMPAAAGSEQKSRSSQTHANAPEPSSASSPVREVTVTQPQPPIDAHERFLGSMLGGAMGDALGYAIEFSDIGMIRHHHGENGLAEPVLRDGVVQISDDTQMMLFTLEGLVRAHVARRVEPRDNDPIPEVQHAYQRWFHTQNQAWEVAGGPYARQLQRPDGWLITNWELFASRAPGSTCMSALANFAQTGVFATPQHRINNSKGCGGVMRAAPVAAWSNDPSEVFLVAVRTAALTHSHPSGFLSAGVLAVVVHQLIRDVPLREAVRLARELLTRWPEHEEQLRVLDRAVALAEQGPVPPEELKAELGEGWVGEEALAIGLYAVLATDNLRDALLLSVNHSGDSDSTGIVCGNIGGAVYGTRAIPPEWLQHLELREVIETVANDALAEFSPGPLTDPSWTQRYPAW